MSKKGTKALASATLMSLVLTTALSAGPVKAAAGQVTRVGEADRYATAAKVATENWKDGAKDVVLVSGEGYADAVSASALAKKLNAPIILTTANSLNDDAKQALEALKPANVYVVGGNASVSSSVRSKLKDAKFNLVELQGKDRYETNVKVAEKLVELGVSAENVMLVGGEGFSDALSVAPVAAAKGQILLLGNNNSTSMKSVLEFVKANKSKVTVVGTSYVISDDMFKALGATERVNGGANRFETNLNVLNKFSSDLKADKLFVANATGDGYADALVASALAGKTASPLVLVDTETSAATTAALKYIQGKATKTTDLNVVGGTGVVSQNTVNAINEAVNPTKPTNPTGEVSSIEAMNLNQIKVVFNQEVDEDTAEDVVNYKVDGSALKAAEAKAVLQNDNKTVIITMLNAQKQYDNIDVTVKKGILTEDKSLTIPEFTQSVEFKDTTVPTLKSVTAQGNNKITVEFSEAVNMKNYATIIGKIQIDGRNLSSYGLDQSYSEFKDAVTTGSAVTWTNKVEFYFSSPLPTGNRTLKVLDGEKDAVLCDAAGFTFKETTMDFNVDTVTGKPEIKDVKATDDGKVYINFNRPMDKKTARDLSYYGINGDTSISSRLTTGASIELKEGDTQVKITGVSSLLKAGSNTIYVKDSVKDAYGNKVADNTRRSFDLVEDETKPTVTSVTIIDSKTIRVRFSKDVKATYAKNKSNYKLKDKDGVDLSSTYINNITIPGDTAGTKASANVFDINMNSTTKLTSGNYTLTIKNIVDTASTPNTMDDYTATISGSDDVAPTIDTIVNKAGDAQKTVVFFSEEMDSSTITNTSNYKFVNESGDTKALPSGATITPSADNKSVTIKFPSSYRVWAKNDTKPGVADDNIVTKIVVANVKDAAGNTLDTIADSRRIELYTSIAQATIDSSSFKLFYDGDNLKAEVKFTRPIDNINIGDFSINGVTPDSGYVNGDKVTLVFNDGRKVDNSVVRYSNGQSVTTASAIDLVKDLGVTAKLVVNPTGATPTTDESGRTIATDRTGVQVYDYQAAPKTTSDYWTVSNAVTTEAAVYITFDTNLDVNSGIKVDDFVFTADNGTNLEAKGVSISGDTIKFTFDTNAGDGNDVDYTTHFANSKKITIRAKSTVSIRTEKDRDGNYASYAPSSDDLKDRAYTVNASGPQTH